MRFNTSPHPSCSWPRTTPKSPSVLVVSLLLLECSLQQWTPQCLTKASGGPLTPAMGFSGPPRLSQNQTEEGKPERLFSSRAASSAASDTELTLTMQTFGDCGQRARPPVRYLMFLCCPPGAFWGHMCKVLGECKWQCLVSKNLGVPRSLGIDWP